MAARVFLVVAAVVAVVSCDRGYSGQGGGHFSGASIVKDQRSQNAYGEYSFHYQTSDGTTRQEEGKQDNGQVAQGKFRYTSPEGVPVEITFVADRGGFQPIGAALPVPPSLPYHRVQSFNH